MCKALCWVQEIQQLTKTNFCPEQQVLSAFAEPVFEVGNAKGRTRSMG